MKKLLVFQHASWEILGTLNPLLKDAGFRIRYINFDRHPDSQPSMEGYDGLVVLGGNMSANDTKDHPHLVSEMKSIESALKDKIPVLGICLGAQLLAKTLGSKVYPAKQKEIGWFPLRITSEAKEDTLFKEYSETETVFQWHGDTFDLPHSTKLLASSEICENQAFAYDNIAYGLQFHLETDEPMIKRWLTVPSNMKELSNLKDPKKIQLETPQYIQRLQELSHSTFLAFIQLFGVEQKEKLKLNSR